MGPSHENNRQQRGHACELRRGDNHWIACRDDHSVHSAYRRRITVEGCDHRFSDSGTSSSSHRPAGRPALSELRCQSRWMSFKTDMTVRRSGNKRVLYRARGVPHRRRAFPFPPESSKRASLRMRAGQRLGNRRVKGIMLAAVPSCGCLLCHGMVVDSRSRPHPLKPL